MGSLTRRESMTSLNRAKRRWKEEKKKRGNPASLRGTEMP